jgi:uncharacterized protein (DUF362 family)
VSIARRQLLSGALLSSVAFSRTAVQSKLGIPGPYRGRVVAVEHPGSVINLKYQRDAIRAMLGKGMMELTGAPSPVEAWRVFIEPGDVVGIKLNPVGQPYLISAPEVVQSIIECLEQVGVKRNQIVAYDRYYDQFLGAGFDKWLPEGVRWTYATKNVNLLQLDMEGYDADQYMEMALVLPQADPSNRHHRRSYVAKFLSKDINKLINLGVMKHHQSAGVTVALKNLSHGLVNNVSRSHISSSNNACGMFIPTVVDIPIIRQKTVLNIIDGVMGAYHGGPGSKVGRYLWEHKTMYFATDPVAVDRVAWTVLDNKREQSGMKPIALAYADNDSTFVRMQPEFIEIAGALGLGESDEEKIDLKRVKIA